MYKYETHLHTAPASKCARFGVRETLECYKRMGYDGVFLTNHFIDGNIGIPSTESYEARLDFYFADYEEAQVIGNELGLKVFLGIEISHRGTDFLIYGLGKEWFLSHPEYPELTMKEKLRLLADNGAYIVHAHPFREAAYIDHLRLYPRSIHAVEVINACRTDFENEMALQYAKSYGFAQTAGTDNHIAGGCARYSGVLCDTPLTGAEDYAERVRTGRVTPFLVDAEKAE